MIFLFFPDISWQSLYQRPHHLASRLSQHWPVLWVEPATLSQKASFLPVRVQENLYTVSLPFFPYNARNPQIKRFARLLSRWSAVRWCLVRVQLWLLRHALRRLGGAHDVTAFFIHNIQGTRLADFLKPRVVLFDYIDNLFGFTDFPAHMHEEWKQTIQRADIITATSPTLKSLIQQEMRVTVHLVTNGVEFSRFADRGQNRPTDLPPEGSPIVGYTGSVYAWLDFSLLRAILHSLPTVNLVIVGHDHPDVRTQLHALRQYPNFSFLGVKPYADIPAYLHSFTVGIIPFRRTSLTAGVNPVKLYEYSAAGVPTVATNFSEDLKEFADVVTIAGTSDQFLDAVRSIIHAGPDPKAAVARREFAQRHDWDQKFSTILSLIDRHTSGIPPQ